MVAAFRVAVVFRAGAASVAAVAVSLEEVDLSAEEELREVGDYEN